MATPTRTQAERHHATQTAITVAAVQAVRSLFRRRRPLPEVVTTLAAYQYASATAAMRTMAAFADNPRPVTNPRAFQGVSSYGFPVSEPLIATIDRYIPAPPEPLPAPWWEDAAAFQRAVDQLVASEVADAGRTASQVEFVTGSDSQNYVRMLKPPSCARCAILAGRIYRDLDAFDRHPGCDCVMIPVQDWDAAVRAGLVADVEEAFKDGHVHERGISKADMRAIKDGADPGQVINATRGLRAPGITAALNTEVFGRKVKATTEGTTVRAAWRRANPTRLVRLRPESIYEHAKDRDDAIRLLALYGYIT